MKIDKTLVLVFDYGSGHGTGSAIFNYRKH